MSGSDRLAWHVRLLQLIKGAPLAAADEARYQAERVEGNRRRIATAVKFLVPVHVVVALLYWPADGLFAHPSDFRTVVCLLDLAMLALLPCLVALVLVVEPRWSPRWWPGWAADLYVVAYVALGVAMSVNAQRMNGNINVFTATMLGNALVIRQRVWTMAAVAVGGALALVAGVWWIQPDPALRGMVITPVIAVTVLAFMLSRINVTGARAELAARLTIERQRGELEESHRELGQLNRELERRVREQVDEIVVRATAIEQLERHLSDQVVERSRHLARAFRAMGPRAYAPLGPGDVLDGRVEIRSHLGAGAWGEVYRGHDRILGREVAAKVLRLESGVSRDAWVRFAAEAGAAAAVRHPCVVHTLHVGVTDDGRLYQLQELLDGVTLSSTLAEGGRWPWPHAARVGGHLADALAAAHAAGIVHRDVKPSNVMLTASAPGVHLLDFGVSKTLHAGGEGSTGVDLVGTPVCMAPEQIAAPESVSAAADIYALAVLLHELIAGEPPFQGGVAKLLHQHLQVAPPRLADALAPAALADLILRCLGKEPTGRPTAREVADLLTALADEAAAPAAERLPRPEPRADAHDLGSRPTVNVRGG